MAEARVAYGVREARAAAVAFEASGGQARVMAPGGRPINFVSSEMSQEGRNAAAELIRASPEGLAPGVTIEDALKVLGGEGPPPAKADEPPAKT